MNVDTLLDAIHIIQDKSQKLNIYLFGSRVYGTARDDADWDFFIVVSNEYYSVLNDHCHMLTTTTNNDAMANQWCNQQNENFKSLYCNYRQQFSVNVNLYQYDEFHHRLCINWLQSLICIYLPEEFIWRHDFISLHRDNIRVLYRKIASGITAEAGKHMQFAKTKWGQTKTDSDEMESVDQTIPNYWGKKYLVHAFRDLLLGIQLAKYERMVDYTCANEIYHEIMNEEQSEWEWYFKKYNPRYQLLKDEFNSYVNKPFKLSAGEPSDGNYVKQYIIDTLEMDPSVDVLDRLSRYFSVQITAHPSVPDAYHFYCNPMEERSFTPLALQCNGMILRKVEDSWVTICAPVSHALPHNHHYAPKFKYPSKRILLQKTNEPFNVYLFHVEDRWYASTDIKPEISTILLYDGVSKEPETLANLFWNRFNSDFKLPDATQYTYAFEFGCGNYTRMDQRQVLEVGSMESNMFLVSVVDNRTCKEVLDISAFGYPVQTCSFSSVYTDTAVPLTSLFEAKSYALCLSPLEVTFCIVVDELGSRILVPCLQHQSLLALLSIDATAFQTSELEKLILDVIRSVGSDQQMLKRINALLERLSVQSVVDNFQITLERYKTLCQYLNMMLVKIPADLKKKNFVDFATGLPENSSLDKKCADAVISVLTSVRYGKRYAPNPQPQLTVEHVFSLSPLPEVWSIFSWFCSLLTETDVR